MCSVKIEKNGTEDKALRNTANGEDEEEDEVIWQRQMCEMTSMR